MELQKLKKDLKSPKKQNGSAKKIDYDSALAKSIIYFNGDQLAASVWLNKYALKDSYGQLHEATPDDLHRRMAKEIARIEKKYPKPLTENEIFSVFENFKYLIPQGGPMSGIGNNHQISSLSNCFVIGNEADSYGGIIRLDEEQAQLMKRRGGVGHDLSHIRPKGSPVNNSALTSTGIVPFMERYSNCTREVAQDGRRGALMLSVSVEHPDAEEFIDAKLDLGKITGANVSVRITDDFMEGVETNGHFKQRFPVGSENPVVEKEVLANNIWKKIVKNAWKSAEPGILFWDTIINESIPDCYADLGFKTISTNPCGEIPLCPYDSCRLLAINLYSYVENPFTENASFNFEKFADHAKIAMRVMDDIIDLELEQVNKIIAKVSTDPEEGHLKRNERELWEKIKEKAEQGRRTGIGITAEGDMLAALGLRYASDESIEFSEKVHQALAVNTYQASIQLAKDRGAFPIYSYEKEKNNPFISRLINADSTIDEGLKKYGRRNIAILTIAPTGTTSIMTQTSSGLEPVFMVSYKRRRKINPNDTNAVSHFVDEVGDHWEEYNVVHHKFVDWAKVQGISKKELEVMDAREMEKLIKKSPYHLATANDIDWMQKIKLQGRIQKFVDHSISVTVNVPKETTVDMVNQIYISAWKNGCKGVTIYRDGSRSGVLIADSEEKKDDSTFKVNTSPKRPKKIDAEIVRFQNNHEKWIAVVGLIEGRPYEIFTGRVEDIFVIPKVFEKAWVVREEAKDGKKRYDLHLIDKDGYKVKMEGLSRSFSKENWNYAKLISGVLRYGMPLPKVVDLVSGLNIENEMINTWKNGVARALKKFIPDGTTQEKEVCSNCKESGGLVYKEGCLTCNNCGHSKCG